MAAPFDIQGRRVGPDSPAYIVAELSANHGGRLEQALELVRAAADAGADAVKLQTYTPDTLTLDAPQEYFRIRGTRWDGASLYALYSEAMTPWEWHQPIQTEAARIGLGFFSTPFDDSAVDFLETMDVPAYKVASFELVDIPLLRKVAATGKPVILSTGMATLEEIDEAVRALRAAGCRELALLKCTSAYPAPPEEANLACIPELAARFGVPVGLSDHTLGLAVPVAAVSVGACIVEKHMTLRRADGGPDAAFSMEPEEFAAMVRTVREAQAALGSASFGPSSREQASLAFRRSLFAVEDIAAGEPLTRRNIRSIRPGHGLHTRHLDDVLGKRASRDIPRGTPLSWDIIAPNLPATASEETP